MKNDIKILPGTNWAGNEEELNNVRKSFGPCPECGRLFSEKGCNRFTIFSCDPIEVKKCNHEYNGQGIFITANPTACCKKCGQEYECDDTGKPHLIELLGREDFEKYTFGDKDIIKKKD